MKTALIVAGVLAGLALAVLITGALLPKTTRTERIVRLAADAAAVFGKVTDIPGQTTWRRDVAAIEMAPDGRNWVERTTAGDSIAFTLTERLENERFAIAYTSPRGFSGTWIGVLAHDSAGGSTLAVTETVTVPNPFLRALARILAPPGSHTDLYLADLERALR